MKITPELLKAQEKMKPGVITGDGFLGSDTRSIVDIIQKDEETFASLGLDWDKVSEVLHFLFDEGKKGLGQDVVVKEEVSVAVTEARGYLPCPFGDGLHRKHIAEIIHLRSHEKLVISELSLHLMANHHFLQGRGSTFRCEPHTIKNIVAGFLMGGSEP
jgi:hypothetical protein